MSPGGGFDEMLLIKFILGSRGVWGSGGTGFGVFGVPKIWGSGVHGLVLDSDTCENGLLCLAYLFLICGLCGMSGVSPGIGLISGIDFARLSLGILADDGDFDSENVYFSFDA